MDPNETLARLRALMPVPGAPDMDPDEVSEIIDLLSALDAWLSRGGFLPDDWQRTLIAQAPAGIEDVFTARERTALDSIDKAVDELGLERW